MRRQPRLTHRENRTLSATAKRLLVLYKLLLLLHIQQGIGPSVYVPQLIVASVKRDPRRLRLVTPRWTRLGDVDNIPMPNGNTRLVGVIDFLLHQPDRRLASRDEQSDGHLPQV